MLVSTVAICSSPGSAGMKRDLALLTAMMGAAGEKLQRSIGAILLILTSSVFCHASECPGRVALVPGSKVSYTFEADAKSGKAREVQIEEAATQQADGPREFGTIKVLLPIHPCAVSLLIIVSSTVLEYRKRLRLYWSSIWR